VESPFLNPAMEVQKELQQGSEKGRGGFGETCRDVQILGRDLC